MVNLHISNHITLTNLPPKRAEQLKKTLTIPNPSYHRVMRLTGSRFAAQANFIYFKESKDKSKLIVPRGMKLRLIDWLTKVKEPYEMMEDLIHTPITPLPAASRPLLPLQVDLLCRLPHHQDGIISAGTGTGKTTVGLEVIRRKAVTSLILVPNTVLLNQFYNEAKDFYDTEIARIGDGHKEIGPITVATWQSLSADDDLLASLASKTSLVVIDECQSVVSKERINILKQFKPSHIYGLTGTPFRSKDDGRTKVISFICGNIFASHEQTNLIPEIETLHTKTEIPVFPLYAEMIDNQIQNNSRNNLIAGVAMGELGSGRKTLILLKRREHCQILVEKMKHLNVYYADADDPNRNEILLKMGKGEYEFGILIGTFSLLGTGLNIPSLDVLIIGGDLKSDVLVGQSAGRILRLFKGKEKATIYDLHDNLNPILHRQFLERFRIYQEKGWPVKGYGQWE